MKNSEITDAQLISAYKNCFKSDSGRIVLKHLMKAHGVFRPSFIEDNQHATSFNEGGKNVVLKIMQKLHREEEELNDKLIDEGEEYVHEDIF